MAKTMHDLFNDIIKGNVDSAVKIIMSNEGFEVTKKDGSKEIKFL